MDKLPQVHGYEGSLSLGSGLARALVKAEKEAQEMKDSYISTEHLLLGLLTEGDRDVQDLFRKAGLTRDVILAALKQVRAASRSTVKIRRIPTRLWKNTAGI